MPQDHQSRPSQDADQETPKSSANASGDGAVGVGRDNHGTVLAGNQITVHNHPPAQKAAPLEPPFQLPSDLPDFVGRKVQVDQVLETMRSGGGAAISAFAGLGGIGKTVLAVHVAHRLEQEYPDGQIVVEMRGTQDDPLSPVDAMSRVIHAFQPDARLPDSLEDVSPIYQSVLNGRRVLLLLDNARDAQQVGPLVVQPPCGLMITSRGTIILPGLDPINLEQMTVTDANKLLIETAGKGRTNRKQRDKIAELCGRLPLALRTAGTFLRVNGRSVDQYIEALSNEHTRLGKLQMERQNLDVEAVLGLSARQLVREDAELAGRWQMLSVFPADFDRAAVAAVWEVTEEAAQTGLDGLAERNLLEFSRRASAKLAARYRFHDLMRLVARRAFSYADPKQGPEFQPKPLDQAAARHAAHYGGVLAGANELYKAGNDSIPRGLELYDAESQNIHAGQAWAVEHAADDHAATLCNKYPNAGVYILDLRLHPRQRITWLEPALAAARRLKLRPDEGLHLGNLGNAHWNLGDPRRAIEYYEQHLEIAREIADRRGEGNALGNLGSAHAALGEPRRAIEYHEQALEIDREIADRRGEGNALGNLGLAHADLGDPRRAIEYHEQALEIAREIGDRRGEGNALGNLGSAHAALGEPRRAIEYLEQALEIAREIGDRRGEGNALGNLGLAHADLGDPRRAIEYYDQQLVITREIGDRRGEGTALWNMSLALDTLGQRDEAIKRAKAALEIYEEIEDPNAAMVRQELARWRGEPGAG